MHGIASYRSRRVETASPAQTVLLLLQEIARRVELGATALDAGRPADASPHFHHARLVIAELLAALDPSAASELVAGLQVLYAWVAAELVAAGRDRDPARARAAGAAIVPLIEAWASIQSAR